MGKAKRNHCACVFTKPVVRCTRFEGRQSGRSANSPSCDQRPLAAQTRHKSQVYPQESRHWFPHHIGRCSALLSRQRCSGRGRAKCDKFQEKRHRIKCRVKPYSKSWRRWKRRGNEFQVGSPPPYGILIWTSTWIFLRREALLCQLTCDQFLRTPASCKIHKCAH